MHRELDLHVCNRAHIPTPQIMGRSRRRPRSRRFIETTFCATAKDCRGLNSNRNNHTHNVWTHSSQGRMIHSWPPIAIRGPFLGNICVNYDSSGISRKKSLPTAPTCIAITSAVLNGENATLALSTLSNWHTLFVLSRQNCSKRSRKWAWRLQLSVTQPASLRSPVCYLTKVAAQCSLALYKPDG